MDDAREIEDYPKGRGWPAWSAQLNDLVGGWIVTTYPRSYADHDFRPGGNPLQCGYIVAECMTEEDATEIAWHLNVATWIPKDLGSNPKRWRWVNVGYLEGTLQ